MSKEKQTANERFSEAELQAELRRLKENLEDLEEMHAFTFCKTTVHIGAEQAQSMQDEHDEECREIRAHIVKIEALLLKKRR